MTTPSSSITSRSDVFTSNPDKQCMCIDCKYYLAVHSGVFVQLFMTSLSFWKYWTIGITTPKSRKLYYWFNCFWTFFSTLIKTAGESSDSKAAFFLIYRTFILHQMTWRNGDTIAHLSCLMLDLVTCKPSDINHNFTQLVLIKFLNIWFGNCASMICFAIFIIIILTCTFSWSKWSW